MLSSRDIADQPKGRRKQVLSTKRVYWEIMTPRVAVGGLFTIYIVTFPSPRIGVNS